MNETTEQEREEPASATQEDAQAAIVTRVETTSARRGLSRNARLTIAAAVVLLLAVGGLAVWLWRRPTDGAGRPVPAPRTISSPQSMDSATGAAPAEATLTLAPEAVTRAGLRVEPVGERLAADGGGAPAGEAATGVVQANAYRSTPVVSLVGGIVRSVGAELGQNVRRGQTVAVVFSDDLAMAQSRYLTALAELDEQQRRHRRTAQLIEIGAASREEYEQATTKLRTAEAEVASLRQRLLLLGLTAQRVSALRSSSQISSEVSLPAPVSGTVISRAVNPGEVIEANKEMLRVADLSSLWVIAQVYERNLARVAVGSGASVTSSAYPGRVFRGRVSYVDPTLDPQTRTAQARIELANPGQALRIGMFVNVAFGALGGAEATGPVVPAAAVQNIGGRQVVFVATNTPNIFAVRPVRLGPESNGFYPVLEGLFVGERIVTEGSFMLRAEWLKLHPGGM